MLRKSLPCGSSKNDPSAFLFLAYLLGFRSIAVTSVSSVPMYLPANADGYVGLPAPAKASTDVSIRPTFLNPITGWFNWLWSAIAIRV